MMSVRWNEKKKIMIIVEGKYKQKKERLVWDAGTA